MIIRGAERAARWLLEAWRGLSVDARVVGAVAVANWGTTRYVPPSAGIERQGRSDSLITCPCSAGIENVAPEQTPV